MLHHIVRKTSSMNEVCPMGTIDVGQVVRGPVFLFAYLLVPSLFTYRLVHAVFMLLDANFSTFLLNKMVSWGQGFHFHFAWACFVAVFHTRLIYLFDSYVASFVPCMPLNAWKPTIPNLLISLNTLQGNSIAVLMIGVADFWVLSHLTSFVFQNVFAYALYIPERIQPVVITVLPYLIGLFYSELSYRLVLDAF